MNEPVLEPFLRKMRIAKVIREIRDISDCRLLDIGCGFNYRFLSTIEEHVAHCTGIDFKVPEIATGKLTTIQTTLNDALPFADEIFDAVTMLAVLEHLNKPEAILAEVCRVVKKGGKVVLTVPTRKAKPVLEFLAFRIGIVNAKEIEDHKKYYNFDDINDLVNSVKGLRIEKHAYFQFGMNNFCVIRKMPSPVFS